MTVDWRVARNIGDGMTNRGLSEFGSRFEVPRVHVLRGSVSATRSSDVGRLSVHFRARESGLAEARSKEAPRRLKLSESWVARGGARLEPQRISPTAPFADLQTKTILVL